MLRIMFRPFFKRFIGLFISMTFVSLLSIALLCTFGSTIVNLRATYKNYLNEYGQVDEQISTSFTGREKLLRFESQVEEVECADARITLDTYMRKPDGRTIIARVFSFNEAENRVFKRYILKSTDKSREYVNISICRKFAKNNNIDVGQIIELGYFNLFAKFYVNEIIETAEGIYPRANDYIWSDNQDFGYLYCSEEELNTGILNLAEQVKEKIAESEEFKEFYESVLGVKGILMPDLRDIDINFVSSFANQIIVRNVVGADSETVLNKIVGIYNSDGVTIKSKTIGENLPYRLYMEHCIEQLSVATIFLPVFFYSVTMIIIGLFINQIIKTMTPQIGIMTSIGINKWEIVALFMFYSLFMALLAGILGAVGGYALNVLMAGIMIKTYSIPTITSGLFGYVVASAIVLLLIFAEVATLISCSAIFKITPKDAVISNEAKRRNIPKPVEKLIDKAPMNIKLSVNSIAQNPRRFFVSIFSMFASLVLILLSLFFYVAKEEMISQSVYRRLNFDCQLYLTQIASDEMISDLETQSFVDKFEDCYYTYVKAEYKNKSTYLESIGMDLDGGELVTIPSKNGRGSISVKSEGLIIPKTAADILGAKKGDTIKINGKDVIITDVSFQYFHPLTYMTKETLTSLVDENVVSTFFINVNDEDAFLSYISNNNNQCLTVFTRSLALDLYGIFDSINVFIYIMIIFSLFMSFIILCIMSQNALMEQNRPLSVMRAIGFSLMDISNLWTLQSSLQLILAFLLAVPAGMGFAKILFALTSSASQTYPFIFRWWVVLLAFGFVFLVVFASHLISMRSISKWNLADNTRTRE